MKIGSLHNKHESHLLEDEKPGEPQSANDVQGRTLTETDLFA